MGGKVLGSVGLVIVGFLQLYWSELKPTIIAFLVVVYYGLSLLIGGQT